MKRDMTLIKHLLELIEEENQNGMRETFKVWTSKMAEGHISMLLDAGFVQSVVVQADSEFDLRLTWAGHDYLQSIRLVDFKALADGPKITH